MIAAERKEARDDVALLSEAALRLASLGPDEDAFEAVAEEVRRITQETLVITTSYSPRTDCTTIRAFTGPAEMVKKARALVGGEVVGLDFKVDETARQILKEGRLVHLEEGLCQLTFYSWPAAHCKELERAMGIQCIYAQPLSQHGSFFGTISLLCRRADLDRPRLVEAMIRLASVTLQKRCAEARLRESEERFRLLAECSPDVILRLRLRPEPALEYVSPAAIHVLGARPEDLCADHTRFERFIPEDDRERLRQALVHPTAEPLVLRWQPEAGRLVFLELLLTPVHDQDGALVALEGTARDVTARKQAEDALREIGRRKDEFLAVLAHELRNPLAPIRTSLFILERSDPGSPQAKRAHAVCQRQIEHMTKLIDELLDASRIGRGKIKLHVEHVELSSLVRATVEDHRALFEDAGIELELTPTPAEVYVDGDKTRLVQVLGNLLQNAAKFTPRGGKTAVALAEDTRTREAVFEVRDTGVGIPDAIRSHLFEPFTQADTTLDRSKGGLGLGLALVKGLTTLHGGSVRMDSAGPGQGAVVTVRLPLAKADTSRTATEIREEPHATQRRVLVIEDNVDAATSLAEALELLGHVVDVAIDGAEGLAKATKLRPDVVLCDIGLPGMDGYEVARAMRADRGLSAAKLVALTGYASAEDVAAAKAAGFDEHLAKPPSLDQLERLIAGARSAGAITPTAQPPR